MKHLKLDDLPSGTKRLWGAAIACAGLVAAWFVHAQPAALRAPAWIAFSACACFVLAGTAVALHASLSPKAYSRVILCLIALMTALAAWIAFGPGERLCTASFLRMSREWGCRTAFGVGTVCMAAILALALVHHRRLKNSA